MSARARFVPSIASVAGIALIATTLATGPAQAAPTTTTSAPPATAATASTLPASTPSADDAPGALALADGLPIDPAGFGANTDDVPQGTTGRPQGVADEVYKSIDADGEAPVIIRLTEQPNMAAVEDRAREAGERAASQLRSTDATAKAEAARDARATSVVNDLRRLADRSQANVSDLLERHAGASKVNPFWIFNGFSATVDAAALDELADHPDVASVTFDDTIELPEPEDAGDPSLPSWSLEKVNAPDVWGEYGVRGENVVVGIMDGGVDGTHPALSDSWRGTDGDVDSSWFVPTGEDYPEPGDGSGHGTHVAGSIVGDAPGELTGVAPDAEWIAAKIFRDSGSTSDSIIHAGFQWMLEPGGDPANAPDVVNNSWGSDIGTDDEFWDDVDAWIAAGIVPIFANGNNGPAPGTVGSPASFPQAIGVGATDSDDFVADFSSRGPAYWDGESYVKPQISAPGKGVRSAWPTDLIEEGYHTISGTSMAAPHVTGTVALMLAAAPDLTVADVRTTLQDTARTEPHMGPISSSGPNNTYGTGIADAFTAVTDVAHSGTVSGTVTGPDGPVEAAITIDGRSATSDADAGAYELTVPEGTHTATITAYGFTTVTDEVTVTTGADTTLDVTLPHAATHTLSGTVTGGGGTVPDARLSLPDVPPDLVDPVFTDANGDFEIDVAAGSHTVRVDAAGYEPWLTEVEVAGDTGLDISLTSLSTPSADGWRQHQNNPTHSGLANTSLAAGTLQRSWQADAGTDVVFAAPVMDDERTYIGSEGGGLSALDIDTGEREWTFETGDALRGAPAVADGLVYTGGGVDGGIYALDAETGDVQWTVDTPGRLTVNSSPVVADGVVYTATGPSQDREDTMFALDAATGEELWSADIGTSVFSAPGVADGLVVTANADDAQLIALDAATGAEQWTMTRTDDYFIGGVSLVDGTAYVATTGTDGDGSVLAVDAANGAVLWENDTHGDGQGSTPAVYGNLVIAGSHGKAFVAAYDRESGEAQWHYGVDGAISVSAMASNDGYVVASSQLDNRIFALDAATGGLVWDEPVDSNATSSAAYANDVLVTADTSGAVHAFHPTGTVSGTITGPDGPVAATVTVAETGTDVPVNADGTFELVHRPGEYTLAVTHYGLQQVQTPVNIVAGRSQHVDIELAEVDPGSVNGTVTDQVGDPLEGVSITLDGTPLEPATTDSAGTFAFPEVSEGDYQLSAQLPGFAPVAQQVTVSAGETTSVDLELLPYDVAVVGDHEDRITDVLAGLGYSVESTTYEDVTTRPDDFDVVVANGADDTDPGEQPFLDFVDATDAAGTSVVWLDQWSLGWGAINQLHNYLGDPETIVDGYQSEGDVSLIPTVDHPLIDGLPLDEPTQILVPNDWSAFTGYSGITVADLHTAEGGVKGSGVAYQPRSTGSAHVLLGSLAAAASWGDPETTWAPAATTVIDNAVQYATDAQYGELTGTVTTASGDPLAATVQVVDGPQEATANSSGEYDLLLEPGDYTLRFSLLGYVSQERQITVAGGESQTLDVDLAGSGTGTLSGVVTSDGEAVAGANLSVAGVSATSNDDGSYLIADVPGGEHTLEVSATGYFSTSQPVTIEDGEETVADVSLDNAPHVGVIEDYSRDGVVPLLEAAELTVEEIGWPDVDRVGEFDVIVFNDPDDPGEADFLSFLDAMDDAGVSGIFPDDRFSSYGGARLLREYLNDPAGSTGISREGTVSYEALDTGHPLFDGLPATTDVLLNDRYATTIDGYSGVPIANVVTDDSTGVGAAYTPRTGNSVHLLLSGLAATLFQGPEEDWTDDGKALYVNAVNWAAEPGLGTVSGTATTPDGEPLEATVDVDGLGLSTTANADGEYTIALPAGEHTLRFSYFGYETVETTVIVAESEPLVQDATLDAATDVAISGTVTDGTAAVPDADVTLLETPLQTTTAADGTYSLTVVPPGTYELEVSAPGYVRTRVEVTVPEPGSEDVAADVEARPSPTVAIVEDYQDRLAGYLTYWGYQPVEVDWGEPVDLTGTDLVIANLGSSDDPGVAGFTDFQKAVTEAGLPVIWLDQYGRGSFQYLEEYLADPEVTGGGRNDGGVTASVSDDSHTLTHGLPDSFELVAADEEYSWFDEFSGTTVATVTSEEEPGGGLAGVRGRGASGVDVLLGTLSVSYYGYPAYGDSEAKNWTPEAERLLRNALSYALDADPLAGEVQGTATNASGDPVAAELRVAETGRVYEAAADGSFLIPLPAGTWTLETSAFGYETESTQITVATGEVTTHDIVVAPQPAGNVGGVVTGSGEPVDGAQVSVLGTPLTTSTTADGSYELADVPAGEWTLRVSADGFQAAEFPVTVTAGSTVTADAALEESRSVAVVADYADSVTDLLSAEGYAVTQYSRSGIDDLAAEIEQYDLTIFNGSIYSSYHDELELALDAADEAGVSTLFGGQWGGYAIGALSDVRGDPSEVDYGFVPNGIDYVPSSSHPIFEGYPTGSPIPLITDDGNQQWLSFSGYSGHTLAEVTARDDGEHLGTAAGYRLSSPSSVEVLLGSLSAAGYGSPGDEWTADAEQIYLNAVDWATAFEAAQVTGTITSDGVPVPDAAVTAVEADTSATTGADGEYTLDVMGGEYTIEVKAHGYEPESVQVPVGPGETVTADVELTALPRGNVSGVVTSADDGSPLADAVVTGAGPDDWEAITNESGTFTIDSVLSGPYDVTVAADGFLPANVEVVVEPDTTSSLDVAMRPINVGVIGDVAGDLTDLLRKHDVAAGDVDWDTIDAGDGTFEVERYDVLLVNGGSPDEATFSGLLDQADAAETSLVFTGTWGVDQGGIRLLEKFTDRVSVGEQGYGEGEVTLTQLDTDHPIVSGLTDPSTLVVEGGYYSTLSTYAGAPLADISVAQPGEGDPAEPITGIGVGYDWRSTGSVEVVLSASALTDVQGPGQGWTADAAALLVNAVTWAEEATLAAPSVPSVEVPEPGVTFDETVTVSGETTWPAEVTVLRDGEQVAVTDAGFDGTWSAEVPLSVGDNTITAVAANAAGTSAAPDEATMSRWSPEWHVPGHGSVRPVLLRFDGAQVFPEPADTVTLVVTDSSGTEVQRHEMSWIVVGYFRLLWMPRDSDYTLSAEIVIDGTTLTTTE